MATRKGDKKSSELTEKLLPPEQGEGVARQGAAGGDDIEREQRVVIHEESNVSLHEGAIIFWSRSMRGGEIVSDGKPFTPICPFAPVQCAHVSLYKQFNAKNPRCEGGGT